MTVKRLFPLKMAWYRDHEIHKKVARQWSLELSRKVLLGVIDHLKNQSVNLEENSIPDILIPNKPANVAVGMSMELKKGISFFFYLLYLGQKVVGQIYLPAHVVVLLAAQILVFWFTWAFSDLQTQNMHLFSLRGRPLDIQGRF